MTRFRGGWDGSEGPSQDRREHGMGAVPCIAGPLPRVSGRPRYHCPFLEYGNNGWNMGIEKTAALSYPLVHRLTRPAAVRTKVESPGLATPNSFPGLLVHSEEQWTPGLSDLTLGRAS